MSETGNNQAPAATPAQAPQQAPAAAPAGISQEMILDDLKARADRLGVTYHPSIGVVALQEKLKEHQRILDEQAAEDAAEKAEQERAAAEAKRPLTAHEKEVQRRIAQKKEAEKLIRVNITCMNAAKKEWEGEIFTFGNRVVGEIKKFVPFGKDTHVPNCLLQIIEARQCLSFVTKDKAGNRAPKQIKEFGVRYLTPLTQDELKELAIQQAAAAGKV